MYKVKAC